MIKTFTYLYLLAVMSQQLIFWMVPICHILLLLRVESHKHNKHKTWLGVVYSYSFLPWHEETNRIWKKQHKCRYLMQDVQQVSKMKQFNISSH